MTVGSDGGGGGGGVGGGGEGGNTKEESGCSKHEKNPREETRGSWGVQIHGERKHRATFRHTIHIYVRARRYACVVFFGIQPRRFRIHVRTTTTGVMYTRAHTYTETGPRIPPAFPATPTHRLHTYVGTVHIKLGGARSPSLPHKNKKHGSIHKQEGWGCSNLKRTPEFLPAGS